MRPFKVTDEKYKEIMDKVSSYLKSLSMTTNKIKFEDTILETKNEEKVRVTFSPKAYIKMRDIVDRFSSEVGWYGFIDKISDLEYRVDDICVYSQLVTGSTVKEDNEPWDEDMPLEQLRRRHFHGHSHVNMAVSPSCTDVQHREDLVSMLGANSFYLFMITNKSCAWSAQLFDLASNTVYSTDDILIDVDLGDGEMLTDFVDSTKKLVKTQTQENLNKMMNERAGKKEEPVEATPLANGQYTWTPKPTSAKKSTGKKVKSKKNDNQSYLNKTLDNWTDEDWDAYEASYLGYYDDLSGYGHTTVKDMME